MFPRSLAAALVVAWASVASAQTFFTTPSASEQPDLVVERVNPRAMQLLRALDPCCVGELVPGRQFDDLARPYKNAGVWATSPYIVVRKREEAEVDPRFYRMRDLLPERSTPTTRPGGLREPEPVMKFRLPDEPFHAPDPKKGQIIIKPASQSGKRQQV